MKLFAFLCFACLLGFVTAKAKIELKKRQTGSDGPPPIPNGGPSDHGQGNGGDAVIDVRKRAIPGDQIYNNADMQYAGWITVGSNQQWQLMAWDTGSCNMWVLSAAMCATPTYYGTAFCTGYQFNCSASTTCVSTNTSVAYYYGDGSQVLGTLDSDTITIAGFQASTQFAEGVYSAGENYFWNGVMGMCPTSTYFANLVSANGLANYFAVYFNSNASANLGGMITYGGYEPYYSGLIRNASINTNGSAGVYNFWNITIQSVKVGSNPSYSLFTGSMTAIVDTGASLIGVPSAIFPTLVAQINKTGSLLGSSTNYNCACKSRLPTITITINSHGYTLTGTQYSIGTSTCQLAFSSVASVGGVANQWILGSAFISQYYTIFDVGNKLVGFATAVQQP